jgi:hypothetical protein
MNVYTAQRWLAIAETTEIVALAVSAGMFGFVVGSMLFGIGL